MSEQPPPTDEQHLKRSHDDIVDHEEGKPCDGSIQEPERKKIKANNVDEFVEDTKYWYELISNLDSGPSSYKSFDQLEKGLTDREKVIENINQLWHVHKARLILESLDLGNPYWDESWFELTANNSALETNVEHDQDPDLVLKDKVTPKELGLSSDISIDILKEYIKKREDIESHGLFLMEKLFKRCHIHSVEEISEMIEKCISIDEKNAQLFYWFLSESDIYKTEELAKAWVEKWKKYILPLVVKTQNELNLIDDPVTLETNEDCVTIKKTLLDQMDENDNDSFLLEAINFEDLEVVQSHKSYEKEEENDDCFDEQIENIIYCTYLFDLELPDEKEKVGSNFLGLLHCDANNANENVFLKILEMVIKMYVRDTKGLDHQEIEVSELRLAVSLMILDCLNKELTYLVLSQSKEQTYMLYRPVVRVVLDQFIVDYCNPTKYDKYMFSYCTNPDMQPMINVLFAEEEYAPVDTDNIAWDVTQTQRGIKDVWVDSQDYEETDVSFKKHPIWEDTIDNLKDKYITHQTESQAKISRKNLDESMYITIYTNNENTVSEPLSNQNLVSFFRTEHGGEEVQTYELSADNLIENRSIDCHYTDDKSLHLDLIRLLRRGGVKSFDEGSLFEAYISLRNYISICLQKLEDIVEDGNVDVEHIEKITKLLANHNDITKKEHVKLQVPYYYKLDYDHYIEPAKSWEEAVEEYLLDTEVQLNGTVCADTRECSEGLKKDICSALRDEQLRVLCDSFIQCEDGSRVGVFTPIIKHRLPVLYNQFFDSEEKRKNGLNISSVHFEVQEGEQLVFDEVVVTEWLTCIYLGIFEEKNNNLTLQKLLAKWSSEFESDIKITDQSPQKEKEEEKEEENIESDSDFDSEDSSEEESDEDLESESDTESENEEYEYNEGESPIKRKVIKDQEEEEDSNTVNPLSKLYLDEETKDFSLIVNNHTVKVHKYILGMRSSYFKILFSGNFSDKNISEYDVSEFLHNLQTVELFTYFLYHDTLDNDNFTEEHYFYQNLVELEEFSKFVLFEKLKLECHSTLVSHLSFEKTLEMLKESLETNNEDFFQIAHTLLLKTPNSYFENILDEAVTKYYRIMCISLTLENALLKLDYLNNIEQQETTLHPFILNDAKIQIENLHWFIANRASSLDNKFIRTLPQPIQDLISRFYTHDNLGMAVFEEQTDPELESTSGHPLSM